ncbi:hypothetical protein CORC01_03228 [Colletotrichum orchidophilum]|uniref:RBR-type E3 ubiquitin transferase n=1 Tax=Colletotrichum orchidophilum TaxID=1209926 RepID=A0A1G4BJ58_9PEZI|nr:uncharacterized protein CORC01_03228 [Colletotrichum orchidophilum]OHF01472.1 hypothetical protein CORC01_03228 [Colletotrichum orchidophilum]
MAYRDGAELHRRTSRRRHPPSPPQMPDYDWHPHPTAAESTYDPMPYRRPRDFIQGPDETSSPLGPRRIVKLSSAPPTPGATMPRTPKAAAPYRRGRVPVDNGYDPYDDEDEDEDDEEDDQEEESPLGRRRRQQTSSRHRSRSTAHHSRTPRVHESRRSSRYSQSDSETESDKDSETTVSSHEEKRERRRERDRRERERVGYEKAKRHTQTIVERRTPPSAEKTPKRRRKVKKIIYLEEDGSTEPTPRQSMGDLSRSSSRHRSHPSSSRPASDRYYPRQHSHSPVRRSSRHRSSAKTYEISQPPSASKRLAYEIRPDRGRLELTPSRHSKRHPPQVVYSETRPIRRSNTVSGASHVTSHTQSTTSSNRRSSTFLGNVLTGSTVSRSSEKPARIECLVCMDEFPASRVAKFKCGHRMCDPCLKRHFKISITDPQQMPPKCCAANIPLKHVDHLFTNDFKKKWNRKFAEYTARNRIYCPSRKCGAWIKPQCMRNEGGRQSAKCGHCRTKVCCSCNGRWHSSRECPDDEETTKFLDHAKDEGWKRCYKCSHMVELKEGCNHMTCICGAQFCMVCGTKWKSCDCPWFNYETADADRLNGMHVPLAMGQRMERPELGAETPRSTRSIRSAGVGPTMSRSRSQEYDSRLMRRFQENRDEDLARTMQTYELDDAYDRGYGDIIGLGNTAGHFMNEDYRREPDVFASAPVPPAPTPPTAFERPLPTDYMSGVNRARGLPQDPLGQRLAERFSESRSSPGGPRPGMTAPPPLPPLASMAAPIMGPPPPMMGPMTMGPPPPMPPPIPMLRRHTMEEDVYTSARTTRPSERVVPGRMIQDYEMEAAAHTPRSRRRMREEPKSSTLAGLTGIGRGVNRVHEWRNYVWPGRPEGEHAVVA